MSVVDPQVATTEMKLAALFNRLESRNSMEAAGRLRPLPIDEADQTAVSIETNLSVTRSTCTAAADTFSFGISTPLMMKLAPREADVVIIGGIIPKVMAEILVNNPRLAVAVSEKIYKDVRALLEEKKPYLKDADALLAGNSVLTFKFQTGNFLLELENGDFEYRGYSDCIPYPAAFLK